MAEELFLEVHHFEPLQGKTARFGGTPFVMTLQNVTRGEKFTATAKRDPFMLLFRSRREQYYMLEGVYDCAFDDGPTYSFYVSPVHTPDQEWQDYQAIFS